MKKVLVLLFSMILMQTASNAEEKIIVMDKVMNSWMGMHINSVAAYWGKPSDEVMTDTKHMYYWNSVKYLDNSKPNVNNSNVTGKFEPYFYCDRIFEVNSRKRVSGWQYRGSSCPDNYEEARKWVNPYNDPWQPKKARRIKQTIRK